MVFDVLFAADYVGICLLNYVKCGCFVLCFSLFSFLRFLGGCVCLWLS